MKICLFGGTFDPPHIGHLLIAQTICEAEGFDKIVFIPANKSPNKKVATDTQCRLDMLKLAVKGNSNFEISISFAISIANFPMEPSIIDLSSGN